MASATYRRISGIPCLQLDPLSEPLGTVLLYHGWASDIDKYSFFASTVASWGYRVTVPEIPHHGVRGRLDYFDTTVLQSMFWPTVIQSLEETMAIVSELAAAEGKVGIVGHSTGGFVAAGAFSSISRIHAAVVINGSCAWVKGEELFRERDGRAAMSTDERACLARYDPAHQLCLEDGRALLMLHGKEDRTIPMDSQTYYMDVMAARGVNSEYVKLIPFPGVNHQITIGMLQNTKEWLDKHVGAGG